MNADGAFRIGKTHAVCQDYVLAQGGQSPRVFLADGCSSSPDTDIGARLLVRLAATEEQRAEARGLSGDICIQKIVEKARKQTALLGLETRALDATLLHLRSEGDQWVAWIHGDGVLAWADNEGRIHAVSLTYSSSYPNYPNYLADPGRRAAFCAQNDNERQSEEIVLLPEGRVQAVSVTTEPGDAPVYRRTGFLKDTLWVALLSDGVHSFVRTDEIEGRLTTTPIPWHTALRELLAFKSLNGAFVQRRLQRFSQECEARRWQHRDDIALGALACAS